MRNVQRLMGLAGIVLACAPACSTKQSGQIMLALQTDMSLPKDIDRVRIEVTHADSGAEIFKKDFERLGTDKAIRLPATLGITASEGVSTAVRVRVIATQGSDDSVRVLREIVTTIPTDRTAILPITLEFLCNGSGEAERDMNSNKVKRDASGVVLVKSTCPDKQQTCVAGVCAPIEVPSQDLPDYVEEKVFGGGTGNGDGGCFDTATCFANGSDVVLDLEAFRTSNKTVCKAAATGDINIALRTQGGGICGPSGCFVALDAGGPSGWTAGNAGEIVLPVGVCVKAVAGEVVGLVTAPVGTDTCQKKQSSLPTCGPWSASGNDGSVPDPKQPTLVAPGQTNPVALAIADNKIIWTSRGTFAKDGTPNSDGSVKIVPFEGGQPLTVAAGQASPHDIAVDAARYFAVWTNAGSHQIMWASFADSSVTPIGNPLIDGLLQPEGVAVNASTVYWTELASQKVYTVDTAVSGDNLVLATGAKPVEILPPSPPGSSPRGIAAAKNAVCWTYEDKLMTSEGVVACSLSSSNQTVAIATKQRTPRAIAMSVDANGNATSVYWANFDARATEPLLGGGIWKVDLSGASPGLPVLIADEEYPAGLAVDPDGQTLFWTSRSSLGAVMTLKKGDAAPTVLVKDQRNPGSIVATADTVFWINEGTTNLPDGAVPDGAIMKVAK
jgi:hypothetical protein